MGAPSAPSFGGINSDSIGLGNLQQQANVGAQAGSNYMQANPYGSVSYAQYGVGPNGVPLYTTTDQFSPSQQQNYDIYTSGQQMEGNLGLQMLSQANYPKNMPEQALGNMTSGLTGQMLGSYAGSLAPFFNLQTEQAQANLENQGFSPSSSGYFAGMLPVETGQASALSGAEANFMPQAFNMGMQEYTLPYQWAQQSLGMSAPVSPNTMFSGGASLQPTNYIGALGTESQAQNQTYQSQLAQYQANQQLLAGLIGAGGNLIGGGMMGGI